MSNFATLTLITALLLSLIPYPIDARTAIADAALPQEEHFVASQEFAPGLSPTILLQLNGRQLHVTYRNLPSIVAGDRILLVIKDQKPAELKTELLLEHLFDNTYLAHVHRSGAIQISYSGIDFSIWASKPNLDMPGELIGFSEYALLYRPDQFDPYRFVDLLTENGFNHTRVVIPARAWVSNQKKLPSPFVKAGNKFDLSRINNEFLLQLRTWLYYALQKEVIVHVDPFDEVTLHQPAFWARSEWASKNNVNGWLQNPEQSDQTFYDTVKNDSSQPLRIQKNYFDKIAQHVPPPHIIGDGNELPTSAFSHHFLASYNGKNPLCCGLANHLGQTDPHNENYQKLINDRKFLEIHEKVSFITIHGIEPVTIDERYRRVLPLLQKYPHLKVIFSTDGAGLGSNFRRPFGDRPSAHEIQIVIERARAIAGERFAGVEVKIMDFKDFKQLLDKMPTK